MKLKELKHNYVAVEEIEADDTTPGGVIMPGTVEHDMKKGRVVAAGPGRWEYGTFVKTCIKENDVVCFSKFAGDNTITTEGKTLLLFRDSEIFGTLDE